MRSSSRELSVFVAIALLLALEGASAASPVTIPTATASTIQAAGQGLCVANAISMSPANDFPQSAGVFNAGINAFMEMHKADRVEYVLRTIFDLSNNQDTGPKVSWGDFTNAMLPLCQQGGCDMFKNDTTTSFGSRYRGLMNVTAALAGQPLHVGFYADDAVSLTIFDKTGKAYSIVTQPPVLGAPTWRMTEQVTFTEAGLYPIEILYVQIVEHAALEMSFFKGTPPSPFTSDFQSPAQQGPIVSLGPPPAGAGFTLFQSTDFFQTLSGAPSYPNLDQCKQCDRQFVGQAGGAGCDAGYYCNEAALCAPCDSAAHCGAACTPCAGATPVCVDTMGQYACGTGSSTSTGAGGTGSTSTGSSGTGAASSSGNGSSTSTGAGGTSSTSTGSSSTGAASSSGTGGSAGGGGATPNTPAGCSCRMTGARAGGVGWVWFGLVLAVRRATRARLSRA